MFAAIFNATGSRSCELLSPARQLARTSRRKRFKKDLQRKLMIFKGFHGGSDREENLEVVHPLLLLWFYSIELNLICSKQPKL